MSNTAEASTEPAPLDALSRFPDVRDTHFDSFLTPPSAAFPSWKKMPAEEQGLASLVWRARVAWRASRHRTRLKELGASTCFEKFLSLRPEDPYFMISHSDYLVRSLPQRERIALALHHYLSEDERWSKAYLSKVYGGAGVVLWEQVCGDLRYSLQLGASTAEPHEGALTIALVAGNESLAIMSFSCLSDAERQRPVKGSASSALLIARNQALSPRHPRMVDLARDMVVQSPKYLCLAALEGLAAAMGLDRLVGVRHDLQIAYEPRLANSFLASYDGLWASVGGKPNHRFGHMIELPSSRTPLNEVPSKHRKRARLRRELCQTIALSAFRETLRYRR